MNQFLLNMWQKLMVTHFVAKINVNTVLLEQSLNVNNAKMILVHFVAKIYGNAFLREPGYIENVAKMT